MYRPLRRSTQQIDKDVALAYLRNAQEGILSTISIDNGYPYGIAVNHVVIDNVIYFHSANEGHKIDNIKSNPNVSFFVIVENDVIPETYTTHFKSVHVFGKASIVDDDKEKYKALYEIAKKFTGEYVKNADKEIQPSFKRTSIVRIDIEHMEGKQSKNA